MLVKKFLCVEPAHNSILSRQILLEVIMIQGNWWKWALSLGLPTIVFFATPEMEIASPNTPLFFCNYAMGRYSMGH